MRPPFLSAALLAAAMLFAGGSVPADDPENEPDDALASRLRHIEQAFRAGDAGALRLSFVSSGKVRAEFKDLTDGQTWYSPGQLQVIFGQIFEDYATRELAFRKNDVTLSSARTAFARGRWARRSRHGGQDTIDTLTVTLREESADWRILEIRCSR